MEYILLFIIYRFNITVIVVIKTCVFVDFDVVIIIRIVRHDDLQSQLKRNVRV